MRNVSVTLDFNATMNASVPVNVTIGIAPAYGNTTVSGSYVNATRWAGNATIPSGAHDGANRLRARSGRDSSGALMMEFVSPPFTVDTVFPVSALTELAPYQTTRNITLTASVADATSSVAHLDFLVNPRGAGWSVFQRINASPWQTVYQASQDGRYEFATLAGDSLWNNESAFAIETSTVVDTMTPSSSVGAIGGKVPGMEVNVNATATDANTISSVRLYYRRGGSWTFYGQDTAPPFNFTFNVSTLGSGVYELASGATDIAGNIEAPPAANDTFVVFDLGSPESELDDLPPYSGSPLNLSARVTGTGGVLKTVELWLNDTTGWKKTAEDPSGRFALPLGEGRYEFYSLAVSMSGQREPPPAGNDTWTIVDTKAPGVIASSPAPSEKGVPLDTNFSFQFTEAIDYLTPGAILLDIDDTVLVGQWSALTASLLVFDPVQPIQGEKTHACRIRFRDFAGNRANHTFLFSTVPLVPPSIVFSSPRQGEVATGLGQILVRFSAEVIGDAGAESLTGPASLERAEWKGTELAVPVRDAKPGNYTFILDASRVRSRDGIALDGDGDSKSGGDFVLRFSHKPAAPPKGNLIVIVTDTQPVPLPGARVTLKAGDKLINDSLTDQVGRLEFIGLPPGLYYVNASKAGFADGGKAVLVTAGDTVSVDVQLAPSITANPAFIAGAAVMFVLMIVMMIYGYVHSRRRAKPKEGDDEPVLAARDFPLALAGAQGKLAGEADLRWEVSNADTGYVLMSSRDGKKWEDLVDVPKGIDSFTVDGLAAGTHHFRIRARLMGGKPVESEPVKVKLEKGGKKAEAVAEDKEESGSAEGEKAGEDDSGATGAKEEKGR
jgi:hypothetical protein